MLEFEIRDLVALLKGSLARRVNAKLQGSAIFAPETGYLGLPLDFAEIPLFPMLPIQTETRSMTSKWLLFAILFSCILCLTTLHFQFSIRLQLKIAATENSIIRPTSRFLHRVGNIYQLRNH
jgi:hypothetical protein